MHATQYICTIHPYSYSQSDISVFLPYALVIIQFPFFYIRSIMITHLHTKDAYPMTYHNTYIYSSCQLHIPCILVIYMLYPFHLYIMASCTHTYISCQYHVSMYHIRTSSIASQYKSHLYTYIYSRYTFIFSYTYFVHLL